MTSQNKKVRSRGTYPEELKRKIAKDYLSGKCSAGYLAQENGLKNAGVVQKMVDWYLRKEELYNLNEGNVATKRRRPEKAEENSVEELRQKLEQSELKVEALLTMIDIAEKEFNIDIRKKCGAKQSRK